MTPPKSAAVEAMALTDSDWRPEGTPPEDGRYFDVRHVQTYRYLFYKPDGARQMKRLGRWQRATEYGWQSCDRPVGEWRENKPLDLSDAPPAAADGEEG